MLIVSDGLFLESYFVERFKDSYDVRLLHTEDLANIKSLSRRYETVIYCSVAVSTDNVSHIRRLCDAMDGAIPQNLIFVSSYEIYGILSSHGDVITETETPCPDTALGRDMLACEQSLVKWAEENGCCLTILRPGEIIGNCMTGRIRRMTDRIANGIYMHLPGYNGTIPLIHADDLAASVEYLYGQRGIFNITDGCEHRRMEVADAIAYRLNNKRILTVPRKVVKLLKLLSAIVAPLGKSLSSASCENVFSVAAVKTVFGGKFQPRNVVEYLNSRP